MTQPSSSVPSRCVYDIPMALDNTLSRVKGLEPGGAPSRNRRYVEDSRQWTVAPMPIAEFMEYFLPLDEIPSTGRLSSTYAFSSVPPRADTPSELYEPLIKALNKKTKYKSRCPGFVFDPASTRSPHPHRLGYMRPHICLYRPENLEIVLQSDPLSRKEFGYTELIIEVTGDPTQDFFVDPQKDLTSEERGLYELVTPSEDPAFIDFVDTALGQHISYITEILARQCRVFVFSVAMSGSRARLFRWDRAGCVVTESFDIRGQPELLCEFLWRFAHSSDGGRGHDPTVRVASSEEEELFRRSIREHVQSQLDVEGEALDKAVSAHYEPDRVFAFYVLQDSAVANSETIRRYLVSRPVISPLMLASKGTRGFWAVDVITKHVVFLKDTWRIGGVEGDTVECMNEKGIRNIPSLVWHGDVPDFIPDSERSFERHEMQSTFTDEFCGENWTCNVEGHKFKIEKHIHYRIVLGTVGYDLKHFKDTEELLLATYDVFQAMMDAWTKDSRLHQDISIGNIILVAESGRNGPRRGYLIDWDGSCRVDASGVSPKPGRIGTWEFMSLATLDPSGTEHKHTFQDDMESLLYVVLYCGFLWLPHRLTAKQIATTIESLFEHRRPMDIGYSGGAGKAANRLNRTYTGMAGFDSPFKEWVDSILELHWPRADSSKRGIIDYTILGVPISESWTPENMDSFWTEFLKTHTLPRNDRVAHKNPRSTGDYYAGVVVISCPTYGRGSPRRIIPPQATPAATSPTAVAKAADSRPLLPPSPPFVPRRSQRLPKLEEKRAQAKRMIASRAAAVSKTKGKTPRRPKKSRTASRT